MLVYKHFLALVNLCLIQLPCPRSCTSSFRLSATPGLVTWLQSFGSSSGSKLPKWCHYFARWHGAGYWLWCLSILHEVSRPLVGFLATLCSNLWTVFGEVGSRSYNASWCLCYRIYLTSLPTHFLAKTSHNSSLLPNGSITPLNYYSSYFPFWEAEI